MFVVKSIPNRFIYVYFYLVSRTTVAGFPVTTEKSGTFRVTTEPAPTIALSPIVIPGKIVAFAPIDAPFFMVVLSKT